MNTRRYNKAIALEYGRRSTPVVSAKAEQAQAAQLVEAAARHGVHLAEDARLVAALSRLEVDEAIPPELYTAVAVILSWVYWLKGMEPGDEKR